MAIPTGYDTVNPFIISDDLPGLIQFIVEVFDGVERPWVRTVDDDGLLVHAEVQIGESSILFGERKPDWPYTPGLNQVYVADVAATLARAVERGGRIMTDPTPFFGQTLSRMIDPWGNAWWIYDIPADEADSGLEADESMTEWSAGDDESWQPTPELDYIHATMLTTLTSLTDPRLR